MKTERRRRNIQYADDYGLPPHVWCSFTCMLKKHGRTHHIRSCPRSALTRAHNDGSLVFISPKLVAFLPNEFENLHAQRVWDSLPFTRLAECLVTTIFLVALAMMQCLASIIAIYNSTWAPVSSERHCRIFTSWHAVYNNKLIIVMWTLLTI